jgi:hypothetical protein
MSNVPNVSRSAKPTTGAHISLTDNFVWHTARKTEAEHDDERLLADLERIMREVNNVRIYALFRSVYRQMESGLISPQEAIDALTHSTTCTVGPLKTGDLCHVTGLRMK